MTEIEVAIRIVVDLLVRGQYAVVEQLTGGQRLSADDYARVIREYGRQLVQVPEEWWALVDITQVEGVSVPTFVASVPLWTVEEGRSDLEIEIELEERHSKVFDCKVLDLRVP